MKTKNTQKYKIAILSASISSSSENKGWHQLLPAGQFKAVDGRPDDTKDGYWHLDKESAERFIENTIKISKGKKILIDYDHQTLYRNDTGQKALAAGWIVDPSSDMKWLDNQGIYIRPKWTPPAQTEIDNQQWGSLSAVFPYDENGTPLYLQMAAVTNDPGLVELESLAVLASSLFENLSNDNSIIINQPQEKNMNELLKAMLIALGVLGEDDKTEFEPEQLNDLGTRALNSIELLKSSAKAASEIQSAAEGSPTDEQLAQQTAQIIEEMGSDITNAEKEVLTEVALSRGVDVKKFLANFIPASIFSAAALSKQNSPAEIDLMITSARRKGQVVKCEESYLRAIGRTQGIATLSKIIESRSPLNAMLSNQTGGITTAKKGVAVLSATQKEAARLMGKSEAEYLKIITEGTK